MRWPTRSPTRQASSPTDRQPRPTATTRNHPARRTMPGLEDLYREIILDHYRNPRNRGELETPPATRTEGFNPLCGDEIVVYLDLDDAGVVEDIRIGGTGCSISQSSASMMSAAVKGKTIDEIGQLTHAFKAMMSIHESSLDADGESGEDLPDEVP